MSSPYSTPHPAPLLSSAPTTRYPGSLLAGMAALLACLATPAAQADDTTLAPSAALTCLTLPPGVPAQPAYPAVLLNRKEGGTLQVEMVFTAPDKKPEIKLTGDKTIEGFAQFSDVVRKHTGQYRLPCMGATDAPVTLRQNYVFDPLGPGVVMPSAPEDAADAARRKLLTCQTHVSGPKAKPEYPYQTRLQNAEGKVWLRLRFTTPDGPPTVHVVATTPNAALQKSAIKFSEGYRLPCLKDAPLELDQMYDFKLEGNSRYVLRDTSLKALLTNAKSYAKPAFFDLNKMSCPFELRITYKQPWGKNHVAELNQSSPERAPLLNWLSGLVLNLTEEQNLALMGDKFNLEIPCGIIDL